MKLYSPPFAKSLRRAVRARIRASPALKREYRRAGRRRLASTHVTWGAQVLFTPMLFAFVGTLAGTLPGPDVALALISLLAFLMVLTREAALLKYLYRAPDIHALSLLPLTPNQIFRWELQNFFRESLFTLLIILGGVLGFVFSSGFSLWQVLALVPIAFLTWFTVLALAFFAAVHLRRRPFLAIRAYLGLGGFLFFVTVFITSKIFGPGVVLPIVGRFAPWLLILLPTGWPVSLARLLFPGAGWADVLLLFPTLIILWTLRDSLRILLSKYHFHEVPRPVPPDILPAAALAAMTATAVPPNPAAPDAPAAPAPVRLGATAITEIIESRAFLAPPQWQERGWFQKMLWRWLTPRERTLSQVIFPDGLRLTARWRKAFWILAVAALSGFAAGYVAIEARYWIYAVGIFLALCYALALTLASGRAFQYHATSGVLVPAYSYFPAGLREVSRLLVKYSAVQLPALLALGAACGLLLGCLPDVPLASGLVEGAQFGLRAAVVMFALRFPVLVFYFSMGSNDTQRLRPFVFPLIFCMLGFGVAFLALAGAGIFLPDLPFAWLATGLALLDAFIYFRVYGWFYRGNFFDLTRLPRR
jgi:hypothetical protein